LLGIAELDAARLGGGERFLGALADRVALEFGDGGQLGREPINLPAHGLPESAMPR